MSERTSERILMREFQALSQEKWVNVELEDDKVTSWNVALMVINPDSLYYGGYFKAKMSFPSNYPYSPPDFKFTRPLYHPNIYPDGKLCISILHSPGHDEMSGESAGERWSPVQRVESVLLSIISLLDDAECSSPANVDAGVMLRNDFAGYKAMVKRDVEASKKDIPEGFMMPTHESTVKKPTTNVEDDDAAFWADSDEEEDFGGSDTDSEPGQDDEDDDDEEVQEHDTPDEDEGEDVEMPDTEDEAIDMEDMEGDEETEIVAGGGPFLNCGI